MYTLITGASRGLGAAFARRLARDGQPLILVARDRAQLLGLKAELEQAHAIPVQVLELDLAEPGAAGTLPAECTRQGWSVTQLINNAGCGRFGEFQDHAVTTYAAMIRLNTLVPVELAHGFLPGMRAQGQGVIINVASLAGFQPTPYLAVYGATKAFLLSFSEALAGECLGTGIRILTVCPGATQTDFFRAAGLEGVETLQGAPPLQSAEQVVDTSLQALRSGRRLHIPGWRNRLMAALTSHLPRSLVVPLAARCLRRQFGKSAT